MNSVYLFSTVSSNAHYWMLDGKQWEYRWIRPAPWRPGSKPLVHQRQYRLLDDGIPVDCYKTETWQFGGDTKTPAAWNPPLAILHYHGSFDVNKSRNKDHGNLGKRKGTKVLFTSKSTKVRRLQSSIAFRPISGEENSSSNTSAQGNVKTRDESVEGQSFVQQGFVATPKSTLKAVDDLLVAGLKPAEVQRRLNLKEVNEKDGFEGPRNKKQIENRAHQLKSPTMSHQNDLADVYAFGVDHPEIVRKMELLPGLLVISRNADMDKHFIEVHSSVRYMQYYYDTTFSLGDRFVSVLNVRHLGLLTNPVYPLRTLFHEYTDKQYTHNPFFRSVRNDMPKMNSSKTVIITDREASIKSAIAEMLPQATHVFCYLHIFKNVDRWLVTKHYTKAERTRLHFEIKNLLWAESVESYDALLEKYCPMPFNEALPEEEVDDAGNIKGDGDNLHFQELMSSIEEKPNTTITMSYTPWKQNFQNYYLKYLHADVKKSFRGAVVKFGIFNPHSGVTNNSSESINAVLQYSVIQTPQPSLFFSINAIYDHQTSQLVEIEKGLWKGKGDHRIDPNFAETLVKLSAINIQDSRILRTYSNPELIYSKNYFKVNEDVNYDTKRKDAQRIIESKAVDFIRNGYWLVTDKTDLAWKVHFPTQSCDCSAKTRCVHILAVNLSSAVEGNPNFENLQFVKRTTTTEVYKTQVNKKVGKKGRGNRVPVQYEKECENESTPDTTGKKPATVTCVEPVLLTIATKENAWTTIGRVGSINLCLHDLKTVAQCVTDAEVKALAVLNAKGNNCTAFRRRWVNDSVIDAYLEMLTSSSNSRYLTTGETMTLWKGSALRGRAKEDWTEVVNLIMPIHRNNNHWSLAIVKMQESNPCILCYDSMDSDWKVNTGQVAKIQTFVRKCMSNQCICVPVSASCWKQYDDESCGVAMLANAKATVSFEEVPHIVDTLKFRQEILQTLAGVCDFNLI